MSHFAEIDPNTNRVLRVIVIEQEMLDTGNWGDPANWVQTSYNTVAGKHNLGGVPLRKNYAGIGYTYDKVRDAFIPPKPHPSWVLKEDSCQYEAPVEYPKDGKPRWWDERAGAWAEVKNPE